MSANTDPIGALQDAVKSPPPTLYGPGSVMEAAEKLRALLDEAKALEAGCRGAAPPVLDSAEVADHARTTLRLQAEAWERGVRNAAACLGKTLVECDPRGQAFAHGVTVIMNPYFAAPAANPVADDSAA